MAKKLGMFETLLYTLHYTLFAIRYTLETTHYTLYTIPYTPYTVRYTPYTINYWFTVSVHRHTDTINYEVNRVPGRFTP